MTIRHLTLAETGNIETIADLFSILQTYPYQRTNLVLARRSGHT